jgi:peptidoglycan/LPS O-acetylase OafA/YrhL
MFGTYRTILALAVIVHHLLSVPVIGQYAVHGFFILSGYLMTLIMHKSYGYSARGILSFGFNRFLRLYPSYWIVLILSAAIILAVGVDNARSYHSGIYLPSTAGEWLQNLSLFYANWFPMKSFPRLAPPTWALTLELLFYMLIALGVSKSKPITVAWFAASVVFTLGTHFSEKGYDYRYLFVGAASLPFSIGALIFHYREMFLSKLKHISDTRSLIILLVLFTLNSIAAGGFKLLGFPSFLQSLCFYANLLLNVLVISILAGRPKLPISEALDKWIGDFSYPLYLFHWQAGMLVSFLIFHEPQRGPNLNGLVCFLGALIVCAVVSYLMIRFVDRPVEMLRATVRKKGRAESA